MGGLSLGEYSALCFAGAISFEDGVKVTKARGEAMQAASDLVDSSMVSVIGLDSDKVEELCAAAAEKSGKDIRIANLLCKGNYAVSGASEACDVVQEIAKPDFKARMTVRLAVAGAFHTDFMAPAVEKLGAVLDEIEISKPHPRHQQRRRETPRRSRSHPQDLDDAGDRARAVGAGDDRHDRERLRDRVRARPGQGC